MFEIKMLPARQGDAIWITWGEADSPHRMIIDMGTEEVGKQIREKIKDLPEEKRNFDLIIVSHVDRDHIGGVLTCLAEEDPIPSFSVSDIWFNGYQHLSGGSVGETSSELESMGPAQGERLSSWLRTQKWNKAFSGNPVRRIPGNALQEVSLHDGLKLTVLGPTPDRLNSFIDTWQEEVEKALAKGRLTEVSSGLESMGSKNPPVLEDEQDLNILAETDNPPDSSEANGSSISLLLEYQGKRIILSGDAFSDDLVDGLHEVTNGERLKVDIFKLPHHGSKNNIYKELITAVECGRWVFSTDGTQFRHPDAIAVARVIKYSTVRPPLLTFNVPSTYNGWWNNEIWKNLFDYETEYGTEAEGLTIILDSNR